MKSRLDRFAVNCKLNKQGWRIPCEIAAYVSNFHYGSVFFNREFAYITTFEYRRPIEKTFACCDLFNYENKWRPYENIQNSFTNYIIIVFLAKRNNISKNGNLFFLLPNMQKE